jgi:hypothetical protein
VRAGARQPLWRALQPQYVIAAGRTGKSLPNTGSVVWRTGDQGAIQFDLYRDGRGDWTLFRYHGWRWPWRQ